MRIGFTSTSFRQIKSLEQIVKIAADCGADCIEWGGDIHVKNENDALKAKELCDSYGISVCSYASYYRVGDGNAAEWERICRIAAALGAEWIRVWLGRRDSEKTDAATYNKIIDDARKMCGITEKFNIKIVCECHDNTFNNNTDAFLKIADEISSPYFLTYFQSRYKKLKYDLDRIERTLPLTECVHISFSELRREQFPKYDPSYIDTLLEKIKAVGFNKTMLIEYTYIFGRFGLPSSMKKDIMKLREKVGAVK